MHLELWQWAFGIAAALLVGMSKTGIPGLGILVVTLLAGAFDGWNSAGIMLPMLIFADVFAVLWYRQHAQWNKLVGLIPWVLLGLLFGGAALQYFGKDNQHKLWMNPLIGGVVLLMLLLHLLQRWLGPHLSPRSKFGIVSTGVAAGFTTTISNAAGPIMNIYMSAQQLPKEQFMGTIAWYFFLINLTKVPIYAFQNQLITRHSLLIDLCLTPGILAGVFVGKWLLPRVSQKAFDASVLFLAALGALQLLINKDFLALFRWLFPS